MTAPVGTAPLLDAAHLLWRHVFGEQPGLLAVFSGRRPNPASNELDDVEEDFFAWPEHAERAWAWLGRQAGRGRDAYVCAHLLTDKRRVKPNAAPMHALYVDGDGAAVPAHLPAPTAIVQSSPQREQFYWRLTRPVAPEVGEALNKRLAYAMGADKAGWDLTQLLRPPGTPNHKYEGRPLVHLAHLDEHGGYDPDELERAIPALPAPVPIAAKASNGASPAPPGPRQATSRLSDEDVLRIAQGAKNRAKFERLWRGDASEYGDDESRADEALCSLLAFYADGDAAQIDRLFRRSGLNRDKWERQDYRDRTIREAIDLVGPGFGQQSQHSEPSGRRPEGSPGETHVEDGATPKPRYVLLTPTQVKERPPPVFLVKDVLLRDSLAAVYGAPGSFKSFLALGFALDIAAGRQTLGRDVHAGTVVYVSAEGSAGLGQRMSAWEIHNGVAAPDRCRFLLDQPQMLNWEHVVALGDAIAALPEPPVLIVIDTLARVIVGGEENSNKDMGLVIAAVDRLRRDTGACVALIHHTGRAGTGPRGASALDGGLDTMIEVKREGEVVGVLCAKQKDAAEFAPIYLQRRVIQLAGEGMIGPTSIVLEPSDRHIAALTGVAQQIASALWDTFGEDGATNTLWQKVCGSVPERSFYRAKRELLDGGYVSNTSPGARGARYRATVKYLEASGEFAEATP